MSLLEESIYFAESYVDSMDCSYLPSCLVLAWMVIDPYVIQTGIFTESFDGSMGC